MEGVRTEELSGSNLHKLSKSSYQKRINLFSFSTYIIPYKCLIVNSLYNLFYELLTIISITYSWIETEIKGQ